MSWPSVPVSEIAKQVRGVSYDKSQVSNNPSQGLIPILRAGNIQDGSLLLSQDLVFVPESCVSSQQLLRPGDIVVAASSGSLDVVGKAAQIQKQWQGSFGAFCKVVRPASDRIDPRYLHHFFQSSGYRRKVSWLAAGANINNLKNEHIDDLEIPLPPLEEQRRIAALLDKAHQLLGHSRLLIKELPAVEQSIFESLFGGLANGSFTFQVKSLEEIVEDNRIGLVRASNECGPELPFPYLKMDAIGKNGRLLLHKATKTNASLEELEDYSVRDGDVLFNTRNSRELVGKTAVYRGAMKMLYNNNLMRLRFRSNTVSPDFFRLFLGSRQGRSELESRKSGTTSVCAIYWKNLKSMPVPLPPYGLQNQLAKSLVSLERLSEQYFCQEARCDDLVKALQSALMSGSVKE